LKDTWWGQPKAKEGISIRAKYHCPETTNMVVFANQLDNDTSNFINSPLFSDNAEAFRWFCAQLKNIGFEGFLLIKKHPMFQGDSTLFTSSLKEFDLKGAWSEDLPLTMCLEQCDSVVAVNSSLIYEALLYEKPVLQLGLSILSNKEIAYSITDKVDIKPILDWYAKIGSEHRLNRFARFMDYFVDHELTFFHERYLQAGFNGVEFFVKTILNKRLSESKGRYIKRTKNKFLLTEKNTRFRKFKRRIMNKLKRLAH
jgi:hypothetical protein